ncbi:hypothetical protein HDZ31DRAFT_38936 [Schizophyllum fasciatum]
MISRPVNLDVLLSIRPHLSREDELNLSSTCSTVRALLRPYIFSSYHWDDSSEPLRSLWPLIKHLYVHSDGLRMIDVSGFFRNLNHLCSIHVKGDQITPALASVLAAAPNLHTLDFSYLCYRNEDPNMSSLLWPTIGAFPSLSCKPRAISFCSRHGAAYLDVDDCWYCEEKIYISRDSFASLLREIDISLVEGLEVGVEAMSLPFATAYTWASLRVLIITGKSLHPADASPELGVNPDIRAHANVHLGTILQSAPHLRVLRILCRCLDRVTYPHYVVWPSREPLPPLGTVIPSLEDLDFRNPSLDEGLLGQLPPSLKALSLMCYPHLTHGTTDSLWPLRTMEPVRGTRTADELTALLEITALPELRQLRISFRLLEDMSLFRCISARLPLLEVLEVHAEIGIGCLWTPEQLRQFALALESLKRLRELRINTFCNVLFVPGEEEDLSDMSDEEAVEELRSYGHHRWWRGIHADLIAEALATLQGVSRFWLPSTVAISRRRDKRVWRTYWIDREEDIPRLRMDPDSHIE